VDAFGSSMFTKAVQTLTYSDEMEDVISSIKAQVHTVDPLLEQTPEKSNNLMEKQSLFFKKSIRRLLLRYFN